MASTGSQRRALTIRGLIVVIAALVIAASEADGQVPRPQSPTLTKRLGEIADQFRTGDTIWIVTTYQTTDKVRVFTNPAVAAGVRDSLGIAFGLFGPFTTVRDFGRPQMFFLEDECHVRPSSWWWCWPPYGRPSKPVLPMDDVDSVMITVFERRGGPHVITYPARNGQLIDALFFSVSAVEKFQLPYYERLYGPVVTDSIRNAMRERIVGGARRGPPPP